MRLRLDRVRTQLILGVALVHLILMTIFVVDLALRQRRFLRSQSLEQTQALADTLAVNSGSWVLANDVVGLGEVVQSIRLYPELRYAMVVTRQGEILAHTDPSLRGLYLNDPESRALLASPPRRAVVSAGTDVLDVASPVLTNAGTFIGWARVGMGQEHIARSLAAVGRSGALYTGLAIVFGSLFALVIGIRLTAGLDHLLAVSAEVRDGRQDVRAPASGASEIARLGQGFNEMLDALAAEQRRASAAAEEIHDLYNRAPCGYHSLDAKGIFLRVNDTELSWFGRTREELVGRVSFRELLTPASRAIFDENFALFLVTGFVRDVELDVVRSDGGVLPVLVSATAIRDAEGRFLMSRSTLWDNTARRRADEAVAQARRLEEQLRQAQKMEAVGRLAGGVAHDFNNLLTVIQGFGELVRSSLADDDPNASSVDEVLSAAKRAASLTQQLLAFSRRQVLELRVVRLSEVVAETEKMLRRIIGEDVELSISMGEAPGCVQADSSQLEQVLMNLAVNARDAMPHGGRLAIEVANADVCEPSAGEPGPPERGPFVMLAVTDTGVGMNAETLAHLFEPFFTTKAPGKGTGLGLATVYGIVKQSLGHIRVTSAPGRGTTFRIYLPRVDGAVATRRPSSAHEASGGHETILLVEDEDAVRKVADRLLTDLGYTVFAAANGADALALASPPDRKIDLLLTDVVMPGIGGRDLAGRLTDLHPDLKVLYMSGYVPDLETGRGVAGEARIVQKPFTGAMLARLVRETLASPAAAR